ncbi:MAG: hypothetical protein CM1200mP14_19310 [Gammaproteobacteria bacterium]|nr:MAG: hypothetical protein CM1200mP14_19310 [Gammaproteobacteria bacterium]
MSTDEAGLVQSDLVSYLIFGRASSELATGQTAFLQGAVGSFATTLVSGAVATQLGAALAQGIGLDYLSITQAGDFMLAGGITNSLADTQMRSGNMLVRTPSSCLSFGLCQVRSWTQRFRWSKA